MLILFRWLQYMDIGSFIFHAFITVIVLPAYKTISMSIFNLRVMDN